MTNRLTIEQVHTKLDELASEDGNGLYLDPDDIHELIQWLNPFATTMKVEAPLDRLQELHRLQTLIEELKKRGDGKNDA